MQWLEISNRVIFEENKEYLFASIEFDMFAVEPKWYYAYHIGYIPDKTRKEIKLKNIISHQVWKFTDFTHYCKLKQPGPLPTGQIFITPSQEPL